MSAESKNITGDTISPGAGGSARGVHLASSSQRHEASDIAKAFLDTCPGDWELGSHLSLRGHLHRIMHNQERGDDDIDSALKIINYRQEVMQSVDALVSLLGLPMPGNKKCAMWDREEWLYAVGKEKETLCGQIYMDLLMSGFEFYPAQDEGPNFDRPLRYVAAAITQARYCSP
ncbi:hypothetical protein F5B20DRAFT_535489 [Whalleya microplaca]|nr:hypothetical protein F5B20DRAFT_535489 [Whalleya microplaca]